MAARVWHERITIEPSTPSTPTPSTATLNTATPALTIVRAFGDCASLAALYSDDVTWRLNHSLASNVAGPHVGQVAVTGFNEAVFTKFYVPGSVSVEILDELGDEASSVVRFNFRATSRRGHAYAVESVLFAKTSDGKVCEVIELLDTHASNEQHQGNPLAFRQFVDSHSGSTTNWRSAFAFSWSSRTKEHARVLKSTCTSVRERADQYAAAKRAAVYTVKMGSWRS
jgi:ketosteroid isomerase-like protein